MFGNKQNKMSRLFNIGRILKEAEGGVTQAELARQMGVSRSTINKDLTIIQKEAGILPAEDDNGRLFWTE